MLYPKLTSLASNVNDIDVSSNCGLDTGWMELLLYQGHKGRIISGVVGRTDDRDEIDVEKSLHIILDRILQLYKGLPLIDRQLSRALGGTKQSNVVLLLINGP